MSSSDQTFVKAFSRRKRAAESHPNASSMPTGQPAAGEHVNSDMPSSAAGPQKESDGQSESNLQPGELHVDPSVAQSASVWVDPIENEMARVDPGVNELPKPHVDTSPPSIKSALPEEFTTLDQRIEELQQHIHTAYATASFTTDTYDAAQDAMDADAIANAELPAGLDSIDIIEDAHEASVDSPGSSEPKSPRESAEPVPIVQTRIDPPETSPLDLHKPHSKPHSKPTAKQSAPPEPSDVGPEPDSKPAEDAQPDGNAQPITEDMLASAAASVSAAATTTPIESNPTAKAAPIEPFRAAWEVDVFDIPNTVADLFFEGVLFQQIAERMMDVVASGLGSMMITSHQSGEGRSTVAIGIAMAASAAGIRVALIDGDTEAPTLIEDLRLDLQHGWVDNVRGGLPLKEIAIHAVEDGLTLIPLTPPTYPSAAASPYEISEVVKALRDRFDLVVMDGGCGATPAVCQTASAFDSVVIVRDQKKTDDETIHQFAKKLTDAGVPGVGLVENFR